jgi:hypothetical protein
LNPNDFFKGQPLSQEIFETLRAIVDAAGGATMRVSKSQVAFSRKRSFAAVWMPGRYLKGVRPPLVLTVYLHRRDPSTRWKEVVEPSPGRFTHHLELHSPTDVDGQVRQWVIDAWNEAG